MEKFLQKLEKLNFHFSFIYFVSKHLLSSSYFPGTVPGTRNIANNKMCPAFMGVICYWKFWLYKFLIPSPVGSASDIAKLYVVQKLDLFFFSFFLCPVIWLHADSLILPHSLACLILAFSLLGPRHGPWDTGHFTTAHLQTWRKQQYKKLFCIYFIYTGYIAKFGAERHQTIRKVKKRRKTRCWMLSQAPTWSEWNERCFWKRVSAKSTVSPFL